MIVRALLSPVQQNPSTVLISKNQNLSYVNVNRNKNSILKTPFHEAKSRVWKMSKVCFKSSPRHIQVGNRIKSVRENHQPGIKHDGEEDMTPCYDGERPNHGPRRSRYLPPKRKNATREDSYHRK